MCFLFASYEYVFFFLPLLLILTAVLRHFIRDAQMFAVCFRWGLAAASILFYASFGLNNLAVLAAQAVLGYAAHLILARGCRGRKILLPVLILMFLGLLGFYKYGPFTLPIALSFTTFSLISLLMDTARGENRECSPADYLLYFFFFPKLLQGPIQRYPDFQASLRKAETTAPDARTMASALLLFTLGLAKKVLLADVLARPVDLAYSDPGKLLWLEALLTVFAYAFQIYFDFSGYCDMGMAAAWMLGFDLPVNFDQPYRSVNPAEFWKRWHSTLSQFLTRYLYIPLGGNRRGRMRMLVNTMIVFVLSGIWHGVGWGFLIWGLLHGLLVCITKLFPRPLPLPRVIKAAFTFLAAAFLWVPFRAATLSDAWEVIRRALDKPWFVLHDRFIDPWRTDILWYPLKVLGVPDARAGGKICLMIILAICFLLVFIFPDARRITDRFSKGTGTAGKVLMGALTAALFVWCVLSFGEVSGFVYFDF